MKLSISKFSLFAAFILSGCGSTEQPSISPSSGCAKGSAELAVYDNDSAVLCGCQESAARIAANSDLKCTVAKDTVVFIHFMGIQNPHVLAPAGTPVFPNSPSIDPKADSPIREHAVKLSTSGTYTFTDLHNSTIHGEIIVQ